MASADVLSLLYQAIKSRADISYSNAQGLCTSLSAASHIVLPSGPVPKSAETRYRRAGQDYYTLEALYLAWHLRDAAVAEYMKQTRENGLTAGYVSVTERKTVVDWLEGRIPDHDRIDPAPEVESTTPPGTPPRNLRALPTATQKSVAAEVTASPTKRRYAPDTHDIDVVKKIKQSEVELRDRNTVLRGNKPNNFSAVRTVYADKLKKLREASRSGVAQPAVAPAQLLDPKLQARKARNFQPIIIISSSPTALITMHNVKRFLQESTFEHSQDARARATAEGNVRPDDLIAIYRRRTNIDSSGKETETQAKYFVVDSVEALTSKFGADAWDRVVCVMTTGQAWQFRPYKWNDPRQLFHHVKGIYVTWSNDPPNPKIKDWNVTELKIDPHRRHVDKAAVAQFWKTLDAWIVANKPWLMKA
ncbi:Cell division control protein 73 [Leucoagaricus sp. SymC.cos]|nr:Cell division control protein 73 [Leucoagaricus sp. SymC.cos]